MTLPASILKMRNLLLREGGGKFGDALVSCVGQEPGSSPTTTPTPIAPSRALMAGSDPLIPEAPLNGYGNVDDHDGGEQQGHEAEPGF